MKPEVSERLLIEELFNNSKDKLGTSSTSLQNIERLTGDASTRRYYRLFTEKFSFVVCLDNPSSTNSNPFVSVQNFLSKHNVRVPKIYDVNLKKGYILEEDLGDMTLLQSLAVVEDKDEEFETLKKIISILLSLHSVTEDDMNASQLFNNCFDEEKLIQEIEFSAKFFLKSFLKIECDHTCTELLEEFRPICQRLSEEKMVLTHRDFHSRNIMVKDQDYIVIDFQDARRGIPQYDLVSMLEDCYYDVARNNKYNLIKYYYENLPEAVHGQKSFDNFFSLYDDMLIQRVFKAIGSFSYIYETRKDVRYVKYIGFAMEKLKMTLMKDEKYRHLRKNLFKYYYES